MNKEQKAAVIEEVAGQIQESEAIFAVDYRGISVSQAAELRARLGEADATLRVVKNTLTQRAVKQAGADFLKELLVGPTAFTFVRGDAALAAKAIATFRRENNVLEFKGGTMAGAVLTIDEIEAISMLPAREALDAQLVGVLASPVTGLVRGLNQLIQGLAMQLGQIAEQGLVSGDAPTAAEAPAEEAVAEPEPEAAAEETPAEEAPADDAEEAPAQAEEASPAEETEEAPPAEEAPAGDSGNAPTEEDPAGEESPAEEASGDTPADNDETEAPAEGDETEAPAEGDDTEAPSEGDETKEG